MKTNWSYELLDHVSKLKALRQMMQPADGHRGHDSLDTKSHSISERVLVSRSPVLTTPKFRVSPRNTSQIVAWVVFIIAASMLAFYLAITYHSLLNSDSVMKVLLGQEMATQLSLVPQGWDYENDIPIIFPSLIAALFGLFAGPSYPMQVAVDLTAAAILLYSAYAASRAVGIVGPLRLFAPTLLASGISRDVAEFVFGQSAYSGVIFAMFVLAGCSSRFLSSKSTSANESSRRFDTLAVFVIIVAGVAGGPRGLATYAVPMICALTLNYLLTRRVAAGSALFVRTFLVTTAAATLIGGACFFVLRARTNYHSGSIPNSLTGGLNILVNLRTASENWLSLFSAIPDSGISLNWFTSLPYAAHFSLAVIAFMLPLYLLVRISTVDDAALRFLVLLHGSLLGALGSVILLTGLLSHEPNGIPRYFLPLLPTSFLIVGLSLQLSSKRVQTLATRVVWIWLLSYLVFSPVFLVAPAFADWPTSLTRLPDNPRTQVIAALERKHLAYGYATYWHANAITVLSSARTTALPIFIDDNGIPQRQHFMTADRWFRQPPTGARFFLLLDPIDNQRINRPALEAMLGAPTESIHVGSFEILVYPSAQNDRLGFSSPQPVAVPEVPSTCAATYDPIGGHMELKAHEIGRFRVRVTNRSSLIWSNNWTPRFGPGILVDDMNGKQVAEFRAPLPREVAPGDSILLDIPLRVPEVGQYVMKFSFVIEGYAWCGNLGIPWASIPLTIEP